MRKKTGIVLIVTSIVCLAWVSFFYFRIDFYVLPPPQKLLTTWTEDIQNLEKSKSLPKEWAEIRKVIVNSDNSPVHEWLEKIKAPIKVSEKGRYDLEVFMVQWIDGYRYGVMTQYKLTDITNSNTIWEMGRTYKLGIQY